MPPRCLATNWFRYRSAGRRTIARHGLAGKDYSTEMQDAAKILNIQAWRSACQSEAALAGPSYASAYQTDMPNENLRGKSGSRTQNLLNHITVDIVGFQILDRAYRVEFGLHIEAVTDDLFLGNIQCIIDGCERRWRGIGMLYQGIHGFSFNGYRRNHHRIR